MVFSKSSLLSAILFLTAFYSFKASAQTDDNLNVIQEGKLSFSFGLGYEYSVLGFRLNYSVSEDLALIARSLLTLTNEIKDYSISIGYTFVLTSQNQAAKH